MKKRLLIALLCSFAFFMLCACSKGVKSDIFVDKIDKLPKDFMKGVDISSIISLEESGVRFYDFDGNEQDIFKTLADSGVNYVRVRVWNDPFDASGKGYGGGNNDINRAVEIGKRATANGMKLLVDFHYSDFWADPSKQMPPKAWEGMNAEEKAEAAYTYTYDCIKTLKDNGVAVGMVQLGNETNNGIAGETIWPFRCAIINKGIEAVKAVDSSILTAVHFTNLEDVKQIKEIAFYLDKNEVNYDVFGASFYPYWHGSIENMTEVLDYIATTYNKKVAVLENSYAFDFNDTDGSGNTISDDTLIMEGYPVSVQGQARMMRDVMAAVASVKGGIGYFYWEPAWITVGMYHNGDDAMWQHNHELWEKYGSGWASSYAAEYDPEDAGRYYGGSAVENQALFDATGHPLSSLNVFKYVNTGAYTDKQVEEIMGLSSTIDTGSDYVLPDMVTIRYNDGSVAEEQVMFYDNGTDTSKPGDYIFTGVITKKAKGSAKGQEVKYKLTIKNSNMLADYSFEDEDHSPWQVTYPEGYTACTDFQKKSSDAVTGDYSLHYWTTSDVGFELSQTVTCNMDGQYIFTGNIQGGDSGENEMYIFVSVNGNTVTENFTVDGWINWQKPVIDNITLKTGDEVTVGVCIKAAPGAWGTIDDLSLSLKE